jgi:mannose-6-phosphate isomerase-like protein (cupin superfamily)
MTYTKTNYADVESKAGLHFLREPLACEQLGVSVIDVEDGRDGPVHDHADTGQEEVYVLIEGSGILRFEDNEIPLEPGDAVRVTPEVTRQLELHGESLLVVAGAP